jgi:uncharacterized protein (TIGR03067 family)
MRVAAFVRFATLLAGIVPLSVACADDTKETEVKTELEKLKGKWKQVSVESDGKERPVPDTVQVIVTIDGDKWATSNRATTTGFTFRIDPTQKPKTIDKIHKATALGQEDVADKCIYKLDGDTLMICSGRTPQIGVPFDGKAERPKDFTTVGGGMIVIYKRVKE